MPEIQLVDEYEMSEAKAKARVSRVTKDLGGLHGLLLRACPPDRFGMVSIPLLAKSLNLTHQYVYKWISEKRLPAKHVKKLLRNAEGRVEIDELLPYILN